MQKKKRKDEVVAERQHKQEERAVRHATKDKERKAELEEKLSKREERFQAQLQKLKGKVENAKTAKGKDGARARMNEYVKRHENICARMQNTMKSHLYFPESEETEDIDNQ